MGTSSLTIIKDENNCRVLGMYRHQDGYPSGHGVELALWLQSIEIVRGISASDEMGIHADGIGCLAAQTVCHFADKLGSIRLVSQEESSYQFPDSHEEPLYDYVYVVEFHNDNDFPTMEDCNVTAYEDDTRMFRGTLEEFELFCKSQTH
jgi:hypothetical protein